MMRRSFIKFSWAAAMLLVLPRRPLIWLAQAPVERLIKNILYRGTVNGKIYISKDRGKTWQLNTDLGLDYSIQEIYPGKHNQVYLKVGYQQYSFLLSAAEDDKVWRTVDM
jgi:hypothetical protein